METGEQQKEIAFKHYSLQKNNRPRVKTITAGEIGSLQRQRISELLGELLRFGFSIMFSYRIGPCDLCHVTCQTYWQPSVKRWICPVCFYSLSPIGY